MKQKRASVQCELEQCLKFGLKINQLNIHKKESHQKSFVGETMIINDALTNPLFRKFKKINK